MTRPRNIKLDHGNIDFPTFFPDGTKAVVRALDANDLENCGVNTIMMNTFHLMQNPGSSTIKSIGGLHSFCNWSKPIVTDSGGFQIYSLIHQNPKMGQIRSDGAHFKSQDGREYNLSPEKSIQLQLSYKSDIIFCLDDCTHVDGSADEQRESVKRTIDWAKRSKAEYEKILAQRPNTLKPKIFAVVQGGGHLDLRRECAEELLQIGFDGYGYGGWPLDSRGDLLVDILAYTRELIPDEFPMHALGIGHPLSVRDCFQLGYDIFDSALPTRDARRGRLFLITATNILGNNEWFKYLYISDEKNTKDSRPISDTCNCYCCQNYSLSYLHHLFKINDTLYFRLATIHNLFAMNKVIDLLKSNEKR